MTTKNTVVIADRSVKLESDTMRSSVATDTTTKKSARIVNISRDYDSLCDSKRLETCVSLAIT